MSGLLVSVRNAAEAEEALAGGAAIIDVKEPKNGPLGPASEIVLKSVVDAVANRRPVTVALGELAAFLPPSTDPSKNLLDAIIDPKQFSLSPLTGVTLAKFGLTDLRLNWRLSVAFARRSLESRTPAKAVVVAYADWQRANSPPPYDVMGLAIKERFAGFLIDTWGKDGSTLLDWIAVHGVLDICRRCREAGLPIALAGSLSREEILTLLPAQPDLFAVRGAACVGGRQGTVSRERVAELVGLL